MKKLSSLLLVLTMILSLCACGGKSSEKSYDPSEGNVLITEDMIDDIKSTVLEHWNPNKLSSRFESDALRAANVRIDVSSGYENMKEFTSIEITSDDYDDDWHYSFYGKIHGKDIFNKSVSYDFSITVVCKENSSEENGYSIERDGIKIDI